LYVGVVSAAAPLTFEPHEQRRPSIVNAEGHPAELGAEAQVATADKIIGDIKNPARTGNGSGGLLMSDEMQTGCA
jgi:hypothetical protein